MARLTIDELQSEGDLRVAFSIKDNVVSQSISERTTSTKASYSSARQRLSRVFKFSRRENSGTMFGISRRISSSFGTSPHAVTVKNSKTRLDWIPISRLRL